MIVLIDNGHGSDTLGKCSPDKSLREYKWAREVAQRIASKLTSKGYDARLLVPEENDISLKERCRRANAIYDKAKAEGDSCIFISIHANAAGADGKWKTAGGWCVYTSPGKTKADELATDLWNASQTHLAPYIDAFAGKKEAGCYDKRQVPVRADWSDGDPDYEARFYVLVHTKCPAVLTESLFQDNKSDVEFMLSAEGMGAIVNLHVAGILKYITDNTNKV